MAARTAAAARPEEELHLATCTVESGHPDGVEKGHPDGVEKAHLEESGSNPPTVAV